MSAEPRIHLHRSWTWYFDGAQPKGATEHDWDKALKELGTFGTVQDFWRYWNNIHLEKLTDYSNIRMFKSGVAPKWEDPENARGGKWYLSVPKSETSRAWLEIVLCIIGEELPFASDVCGAVLSCRPRVDTLTVWNRDCSDEAAVRAGTEVFESMFRGRGVSITYQSHQRNKYSSTSTSSSARGGSSGNAWARRTNSSGGGTRESSGSSAGSSAATSHSASKAATGNIMHRRHKSLVGSAPATPAPAVITAGHRRTKSRRLLRRPNSTTPMLADGPDAPDVADAVAHHRKTWSYDGLSFQERLASLSATSSASSSASKPSGALPPRAPPRGTSPAPYVIFDDANDPLLDGDDDDDEITAERRERLQNTESRFRWQREAEARAAAEQAAAAAEKDAPNKKASPPSKKKGQQASKPQPQQPKKPTQQQQQKSSAAAPAANNAGVRRRNASNEEQRKQQQQQKGKKGGGSAAASGGGGGGKKGAAARQRTSSKSNSGNGGGGGGGGGSGNKPGKSSPQQQLPEPLARLLSYVRSESAPQLLWASGSLLLLMAVAYLLLSSSSSAPADVGSAASSGAARMARDLGERAARKAAAAAAAREM